MRRALYRYSFAAEIPLEEVEVTLVLALLGAESLYGEAQVRLDVGFLRREFGEESFTVERVLDASAHVTPATTVGC
jgi:hypothetical protein